ncbi:MAG: polyprenol monophosphomannose synthase [Chloroflexota bacterium]|nr:polyprenol monophosphomannose synthase [Chloroflexota bacterium]
MRDLDGGRVLVILPCYNERDNIARLVRSIFDLRTGLDILVIDDNSPDGTGQLAEGLRSTYSELAVIHRPGKLGLGSAYRLGFRYALNDGYGYVITMDADFSHQPKYLPRLRGLADHADLVIGSRYVPQGGATGWPLQRRIVSGFANWLARTVLGLSTHDCTSGFRCYRRSTLELIEPESIVSDGYSFLVEMLHRVEIHHLQVHETPIIFVDRARGRSKISRIEVYKTLGTLGRLRYPRLPWDGIFRLATSFGEPGVIAVTVVSSLLFGGLWLRRRP